MDRIIIRLALSGNLAVVTILVLFAEIGRTGRIVTLLACWFMTGMAWAAAGSKK